MALLGFPYGSDGKESACNAEDPGSIPGSGRSPGEWNGNPLQYSCLENSMDKEAWRATVHGIAENQTRLNDCHFTSRGLVKVRQVVSMCTSESLCPPSNPRTSTSQWTLEGSCLPGGDWLRDARWEGHFGVSHQDAANHYVDHTGPHYYTLGVSGLNTSECVDRVPVVVDLKQKHRGCKERLKGPGRFLTEIHVQKAQGTP